MKLRQLFPPLAILCLPVSALAQHQNQAEPHNPQLPILRQSIDVRASPIEPTLDRRDQEVYNRTLFGRDDQILDLLAAGISAGQHEGGGKSVEVRRFGFNLDHGGVNGGLKVLVDDVPQNQTTQGHGQGYLGSLKTLIPELVQEVEIINGPFRAEYGDFSGLGVVHIRLKESFPQVWTVRAHGAPSERPEHSYPSAQRSALAKPSWLMRVHTQTARF